jgi:glycosyltransferase involved in cell wall biosynthesis
VLLDAFGRVRHPNAFLDIAGAGELAGACTAAAATDCRIRFHGFVRGDDKDRLFRLCQVLLFPSVCWEVAGLVLLEALGYGLPVVASRTGGIPEYLEEGVTGFLVEPGDPAALAARIEALAADPSAVARLGSECRARAGRLTLEGTVTRLLELYEAVRVS